MDGEGLVEPEERPLGTAARAGLVLLGAFLVAAGLFTGFYAVGVVAGELGERPVQPLPVYALGVAILAFPLLLVAMGFLSLGCRERGRLRPIALLAAAVAADLLLAAWLVRLPTGGCAANAPWARDVIDATSCIDRSWSPPS